MDTIILKENFENTQSAIEKVIDATDDLVGGPLDKLIDNLSKTADGSKTASQSLEKFADDLLITFTKNAVDAVFDGMADGKTTGKSNESGYAQQLAMQFLPQMFGGGAVQQGNGTNGVQVIVNNNAQATAQVQERNNSRGQREIEIMIDNMVANSLVQGSQTRSVLQSVFGLSNLLKSR